MLLHTNVGYNMLSKFDFQGPWLKVRVAVAVFSSPGLCSWRAYVVTQLLASASVLAQCLSFQRCA